MYQIINEHLNNNLIHCLDFLSLKNFLIPFIVEEELRFQNIKVYYSKESLDEGIIINTKKEGYWIRWYDSKNKWKEEFWKNGKEEGYSINYYNEKQIEAKKDEGILKDKKRFGYFVSYYNKKQNIDNKIKEYERFYIFNEKWKIEEIKGYYVFYDKNGNKISEGNKKKEWNNLHFQFELN